MTRRTGMRPLRIAMIGQKGIPARFGGVETHVDNVSTRLAARGHDVWVFGRSRFRPGRDGAPPASACESGPDGWRYRGVRLAFRPSVNTKHLDAASHALLCTLEAGAFHGFDIVHFHGIGPAAFAPIAKFLGRRVVSTFHALDWRQVKWGKRAKRVLRRGESRGARYSDGLVAVSRLMQEHIRATHGVEATYIPNGASPASEFDPESIRRWGLVPGGYVLAVGRIIPDREYDTLIEAFCRIDTDLRLVIVGAESPRTAHSDRLEQLADERVVFTGEVFGDDLDALYAGCRLFVLASRVEGLPITACEAMAHARPLLLSDIAENLEVGGDAAVFFKCSDSKQLELAIGEMIGDESLLAKLGARGRARVESVYNWDRITDEIESLYYRLAAER